MVERVLAHLVNKTIPKQSHHQMPSKSSMTMPSSKETTYLGTRTLDVDALDTRVDGKRYNVIASAEKLQGELESAGVDD